MKDISFYFKPRFPENEAISETLGEKIISHTENYFPDLKKSGIALIYCPEYRNASQENNPLSEEDGIIHCLKKLNSGNGWNFEIYDLGTIIPGNEIKDTYFALSQVVSELIKIKVLPIVIGGTQDLTFALYQAYQELEQMVNITNIDSRFDLGAPEEELAHDAFISQILMHRPCYLFNCSNIGIQAPYVKKSELDLFEKLYFDVCRLGEFTSDYRVAEPLIRNTDLLSIDINALRKADFNGKQNTPNGFSADQLCQLARYAGISDKLSCLGVFNVPQNDSVLSNHQLIAEMLWYFFDAYSQRKGDFPLGSKKEYTKFIVHLDSYKDELIFYKSPKSDRWWMEVPYPSKQGMKYERHHLVPCNFEDYQAAMKNEMPDLWWKTFQKLA